VGDRDPPLNGGRERSKRLGGRRRGGQVRHPQSVDLDRAGGRRLLRPHQAFDGGAGDEASALDGECGKGNDLVALRIETGRL
jgi:hypothetical protein